MAAPKKTVATAPGSISKMLRGANVASTDKKKGSVPVVDVHGALADKVGDALAAMKDAETSFRLLESQLLEIASTEYAERAGLVGSFTKSLDFGGSETAGVQVTFQDKFTEIPVDQEPALRAAMGPNFEKHFEENRKLTLTKTDDVTIAELINALGEEKFQAIFQIKVTFGCKTDMDRTQFALPAAARAIIKQYKASVKLIKE